MKKTLITLVNARLDDDIRSFLNVEELSYNVFITSKKLIEVQSYLYGNCGYSMFDVICAKLDKLTIETLNNK